MAFEDNPFDFTVALSTFLATAVPGGNGTYGDLMEVLKVDEVGKEGDAGDARTNPIQLYGNLLDSFMLAAYPILGSRANQSADTNSATPVDVPLFDLSADHGGAVSIELEVVARAADAEDNFSAKLGGLYYVSGGTILVTDPISTERSKGAIADASADIVFSAGTTNMFLRLTGVAGVPIKWTIVRSRITTVEAP